jgi:hypothetical protein
MSFLNSILLLFGAFALVPFLIHLLNRQRVKVVQFSSLRYLKSLQKTRMRRLKIRQLLLLLLRMLIVLTVVAAFARPTVKGSYSGGIGSAAKTSAAILLDNSLSMSAETRDGTLFERGRSIGVKLLGAFGEGDEVFFSTFNSTVPRASENPSLDLDAVGRLISHSEQSYGKTDPELAIATAIEVLEGSANENKELYVISDFSTGGWSGFTGPEDWELENTSLYLIPIVDPEPDNIRLTSMDFGRELIYPQRPVKLKFTASSDNADRVSGYLASLYADNKRVSQIDIDMSPGSDVSVEFSHTFEEPGLHFGHAELEDDAIAADNSFYFTLSIPDNINVLAISELEDANRYIKLAIKPALETPTQISVKSISLASLPGENLYSYNCIILNGIKFLSEATYSAVNSYVSSGGSVMIFMPADCDQRSYSSRILERYFGTHITGESKLTDGGGFLTLERIDGSHPLFMRYADIDEEKQPSIRFTRVAELSRADPERTLAYFSNGDPAILEADWGQGKALLMASDINPESTDLVRHPLFVTFVNRAIEFLSADLSRVSDRYTVGDVFERQLNQIESGQQLTLVAPDEDRTILTPAFQGRTARVGISNCDTPGIYRILASDSLVDIFAVNVDASETQQKYVDVSSIKRRIRGVEPVVLSDQQADIVDRILENRRGREIWQLVLLVALGLVALEMVIAKSGKPTESTPEP